MVMCIFPMTNETGCLFPRLFSVWMSSPVNYLLWHLSIFLLSSLPFYYWFEELLYIFQRRVLCQSQRDKYWNSLPPVCGLSFSLFSCFWRTGILNFNVVQLINIFPRMVIAFCVLRNLCLRQFLWQQLMQGWKIVMHCVAWTSKHYSQNSKGDPKKPNDETWDVCSCHLCGEKSEDLVYFAFSKYSEVQYIVWEREIQIWWNGKVHFEQEMENWRWVKRGNKKRSQYPKYPP